MNKRNESENHGHINFTFEEIFRQNEKRIHYHTLKLGIHDPHREYYSEGLYAMWNAYKKYEPDKGPFATYFNYIIRNRLIDKIRKETRTTQNEETFIQNKKVELDNGNHFGTTKLPVVDPAGIDVEDNLFWKEVKSQLTEKQWKWVKYSVIERMTAKEIAVQEGVSEDAVKSWAKEARRKLRKYFGNRRRDEIV